jgi:hypothetical protein
MIWGGAVMLVLFLTAVGLVSVNVIADIKWVQLKPSNGSRGKRDAAIPSHGQN